MPPQTPPIDAPLYSWATGIRRGELLGLRWRHVDLVDKAIRIRETWVRHGVDTPKSKAGNRTIAVGSRLSQELLDHLERTPFKGVDERVML